jgi:hypothetical protein
VDSLIRRWAERVAELSTGQRFRYNNLNQTYAKYQDIWRKKLIQKESGTTQHHFGAAAKAIEAERARKAALEQAAAPPPPAAPAPSHAVAEATAEAAALAAQARHAAFALAFTDPEREKEKVTELYHKLIEARTKAGEKTGAPSLNDFERFVREKTKDLKDKGGREVEYTVSVEGGRVKLKARISS